MIEFITKLIMSLVLATIDGLIVWWLNPFGLGFQDSWLVSFLLTGIVGSALIVHELTSDL